jgi:hypothetical protein
MEFSPRRSLLHRKLYRNGMFAVTLAASSLLCSSWLAPQLVAQVAGQDPIPQFGHKPASNKGPRAIGLIQLSPKGKARLTPIAVMMDGKFYDAGSYKAAPVPMALDFGIVYEGFRSGVSQGVFTITQPGQLNHVWIAEGTWLPAGEKAPEKSKKYSTPVIEDKDAPPVLHRHSDKADSDSGSDKDKDKKDQQKPVTPPPPPPTAPPASAPSPPSAPEAAKAPATPETAKASAPAPASDETIEDPNRPRLRRGKPDSSARREPYATFDPLTDAAPAGAASAGTGKLDAKTAKDSVATSAKIAFIPAISDAGGPDPRPYTYDVKPAEEASYRSKMLALAATQLLSQANAATKEAASAQKTASAHKSPGKSAAKLPKPAFDDVSLRIFDLSNSNEPVLVLSAKSRPAAGATESFEEPKEITLIARTNLEGELKKLFFSQTDSRHLDVAPRMELIDAVDADGDGRGELLFRRTSDGGSAYAIYRVTSDHLWPLFEGTP